MKYFLLIVFVCVAFISCKHNKRHSVKFPTVQYSTNTISQKDSINMIEDNVKEMLKLVKRDYPDGKNKTMDSARKALEKRVAELDSLKNSD